MGDDDTGSYNMNDNTYFKFETEYHEQHLSLNEAIQPYPRSYVIKVTTYYIKVLHKIVLMISHRSLN